MSKSPAKIDLTSLTNILKMTKIDPCLPARHLRSLLEGCVDRFVDINADFFKNFRRRCQLYHATHADVSNLNNSDAIRLTSTSNISRDELSALDQPGLTTNIHNIYSNIMQNGSSS